LKTATRLPSAASVWAIVAATTVLPTSVPVPVTKTLRSFGLYGRRSATRQRRRAQHIRD
jgi:hypothetical protein